MKRPLPGKRASAERLGRWAEMAASLYLRLKGYRILGRRIARPPIEIDILAERGGTLVIVEVKYRQSPEAAALALSPEALRRLLRAADQLSREAQWRNRNRRPPSVAANARVDLIALAPWRWPRHIENVHP